MPVRITPAGICTFFLVPERFVSTGTIEEKVFQRQLSKEGLQNIVDDKEEVRPFLVRTGFQYCKRLFSWEGGVGGCTHYHAWP